MPETYPQCKKCRREGEKLFLKGEKCLSSKCPMLRRNYPPGIHGPKRKRRMTGYGTQLREKQKAKRLYSMGEKQFRNYFEKAVEKKGDTGEILVAMLEARLDNVVHKLGFTKSRRQARQLVNHAHFLVNGKKVNIPSYQTKTGEIIELREKSKVSEIFLSVMPSLVKHKTPSWLSLDAKTGTGKIVSIPQDEELKQNFDPKLIVEFYSR
ncbi:MAG: 30S ribosomal protein S4 [Patescibacteria group bacterium]|nr:30S ribosomal protein S4 [Patescibacteria group bacterium]